MRRQPAASFWLVQAFEKASGGLRAWIMQAFVWFSTLNLKMQALVWFPG